MTEAFLELRSVVKNYAGTTAVDHVSLKIPGGCIYGLLGPNGAGKTSMIRMITRITQPDSGEILLEGIPLKDSDTQFMGYMPEERGLYRKMKVRDHLEYLLKLKGKTSAEARSITLEWMKDLGISDWANKKVGDLSKGMQQKVQFIGTVAHLPKLIILDEPFSGLDPINSQMIEQKMTELKQKGHSILFSTHRMEQVEEFCDHIALINKGRIVLEGPVLEVRRRFQKSQYQVWYEGNGAHFRNIPGVEVISDTGEKVMLGLRGGMNPRQLMHSLADLNLEVLKYEHHLPRLNEIFIEVVQNGVKEVAHA